MEDKFKFDLLKNNIKTLTRDLPELVANQAKNFFVKSFSAQEWDGEKWQEVKRRIPGTPEYKYPKSKDLGRRTRPILIGKGSTKLRRAVANSARTAGSRISFQMIRLVVDLPYARRHNEGLKGMPKRKYMGDSPRLRKMQISLIKKTVSGLWKK